MSYVDGESAFFSGNEIVTSNSRKIDLQNKNNFITPIESFLEEEIKFNIDFNEIKSLSKNHKTMSFFELLEIFKSPYQNQNNVNEITLEIISRVIKPFSLIGMILISLPYLLNFQRNISVGKRVFLSILIGTITHLFTKIATVVSLKFDSMLIAGPILPTLLLFFVGLLIMKNKMKI